VEATPLAIGSSRSQRTWFFRRRYEELASLSSARRVLLGPVVMIRRWNVVLSMPTNGLHQVTDVASMAAFPIHGPKKPAKPAVAKKRIIRPATILLAGLRLSA